MVAGAFALIPCTYAQMICSQVSECSSPGIRGRLGSVPALFMSAGILFSYILGYWLTWRTLAWCSAAAARKCSHGWKFTWNFLMITPTCPRVKRDFKNGRRCTLRSRYCTNEPLEFLTPETLLECSWGRTRYNTHIIQCQSLNEWMCQLNSFKFNMKKNIWKSNAITLCWKFHFFWSDFFIFYSSGLYVLY